MRWVDFEPGARLGGSDLGRLESGGEAEEEVAAGFLGFRCGVDLKSGGGYTGSRGGVEAAQRADSGA